MSVCVRDHRSLRSSLVLVISRHVELTPFDAHCCHMGTAVKHSVPDRIKPSFVIFCNPGTLTLMVERQSARMSKITHDGLTRSGTGCFTAVPIWQQWASKVKHKPVSSINNREWANNTFNNKVPWHHRIRVQLSSRSGAHLSRRATTNIIKKIR